MGVWLKNENIVAELMRAESFYLELGNRPMAQLNEGIMKTM